MDQQVMLNIGSGVGVSVNSGDGIIVVGGDIGSDTTTEAGGNRPPGPPIDIGGCGFDIGVSGIRVSPL